MRALAIALVVVATSSCAAHTALPTFRVRIDPADATVVARMHRGGEEPTPTGLVLVGRF